VETIITLTTDFGIEDAYVAAMKGVIIGINPRAIIVDISHSIDPRDVAQGAFVLSTAYPYFPDGTIHIVVVDPGVGSQRRSIILKTKRAVFVAPDNGVLSYVAHHASLKGCRGSTALEELPAGLEAFEITNPGFWRHPVSSTFHGRDIFAPIAAYISTGVPFEEFGRATDSINLFPIPQPEALESGDLIGHVLHIDRFGNIITDVQREDISPEKFYLEVAGRQIESLSQTYDEANGLLALVGSSGYLEIALKNGSAARFLGTRIGDEVRIRRGL
jgi:S-adenosylmethionine hydrolase